MFATDRNVIYFPYIRVPDNEWFNRVLLYWDKIGSIVPEEFIHDPPQLGEYMDSLIKTKLVNPINPSKYIYRIPKYTESFLSYVDNPNYPVIPDRNQRKTLPTTRIHISKMTMDLIQGLIRRNLAEESEFPWYKVETYTANQFMAYLAACLGNLPEINSKPITDSAISLRTFDPHATYETMLYPEIDSMRTIILENILPAPNTSIHPDEIAQFKFRYAHDLRQFRNRIENVLIDNADKSPDLRKMKINQFIIETRDDIEYLTEQMKNNGWKSITLGDLLAFGKASFNTTLGLFTSGLIGAVGGAMEFPPAIDQATSNFLGDSILKEKYAAYAVLADLNFSDTRSQTLGLRSFFARIFKR